MTGGYLKGNLVRRKINQLMEINLYDKHIIDLNKAQISCMIDLEIIDKDQAMAILNHYNRLETEYHKAMEDTLWQTSLKQDN